MCECGTNQQWQDVIAASLKYGTSQCVKVLIFFVTTDSCNKKILIIIYIAPNSISDVNNFSFQECSPLVILHLGYIDCPSYVAVIKFHSLNLPKGIKVSDIDFSVSMTLHIHSLWVILSVKSITRKVLLKSFRCPSSVNNSLLFFAILTV